jgi:hypothetical protein
MVLLVLLVQLELQVLSVPQVQLELIQPLQGQLVLQEQLALVDLQAQLVQHQLLLVQLDQLEQQVLLAQAIH